MSDEWIPLSFSFQHKGKEWGQTQLVKLFDKESEDRFIETIRSVYKEITKKHE